MLYVIIYNMSISIHFKLTFHSTLEALDYAESGSLGRNSASLLQERLSFGVALLTSRSVPELRKRRSIRMYLVILLDYTMIYCIILFYIVFYCVMLHCMIYDISSYYLIAYDIVMFCYVMLRYILSYHILSHYIVISYSITLYCLDLHGFASKALLRWPSSVLAVQRDDATDRSRRPSGLLERLQTPAAAATSERHTPVFGPHHAGSLRDPSGIPPVSSLLVSEELWSKLMTSPSISPQLKKLFKSSLRGKADGPARGFCVPVPLKIAFATSQGLPSLREAGNSAGTLLSSPLPLLSSSWNISIVEVRKFMKVA